MKNTWEANGLYTYPDGKFGDQSRRPFVIDLNLPSDRRIILQVCGDTNDKDDCQRMIALAKRVEKLPEIEWELVAAREACGEAFRYLLEHGVQQADDGTFDDLHERLGKASGILNGNPQSIAVQIRKLIEAGWKNKDRGGAETFKEICRLLGYKDTWKWV